MQDVNILIKTAELLAATFTLKFKQDVYITSHTQWREGSTPLSIQVSDGGSRYDNRQGSARDESFNINVGLWRYVRLDAAGINTRALTELADSIFAIRQKAVLLLDNNYLEGLVVRPLMLIGETAVRDNPKYPGLLLKELIFNGGTITPLTLTAE